MAGTPNMICPVGATLGEGPVWLADRQRLWFVDVKAPCIHRFDPVTGSLDRWDAPEQVGWVLPAADGGIVAGLASGIHRFDPDSGAFDLMQRIEPDRPGNRLNDAMTDNRGRLWFGTMDNGEQAPTGHLYSYREGCVTQAADTSLVIPNGPAITSDGATIYSVESKAKRVIAYTPADDGTLADARLFLDLSEMEGNPDGAICDSEGGVWIAFFGGSAARRFAPDGHCTDTVRFPVTQVSKIALGGADFTTAYATTARKGLDDRALADQPDAGHLFRFSIDVPGMAVTPVW